MENQEFILELRKNLHDINNKLGIVSAYGSSLLYREDLPEEVRRYTEIMVKVALESGDIVQGMQRALRDFFQYK